LVGVFGASFAGAEGERFWAGAPGTKFWVFAGDCPNFAFMLAMVLILLKDQVQCRLFYVFAGKSQRLLGIIRN
jgi:hypothetical protein